MATGRTLTPGSSCHVGGQLGGVGRLTERRLSGGSFGSRVGTSGVLLSAVVANQRARLVANERGLSPKGVPTVRQGDKPVTSSQTENSSMRAFYTEGADSCLSAPFLPIR